MSVKCQNKSNADKNFIACQKCLRKKRKSAAGGCFSSHIFLFALPLHLSLLLTLMLYQMSRLEYFSLLEFACGTSATQQTPRQVATCSRDLTQNKFMLNRTIATATETERERVEQRDRYFVWQQLKKLDACFISQFPVALSGFKGLTAFDSATFKAHSGVFNNTRQQSVKAESIKTKRSTAKWPTA